MARSTPPNKIPIDPLFTIPLGAEEEFTYTREGIDRESEFDMPSPGDPADEFVEEFDYVEDDSDDTTGEALEVPDSFAIVAQVIRRTSSGQMVVDIVVEVEDILGAENYEIRVVKV